MAQVNGVIHSLFVEINAITRIAEDFAAGERGPELFEAMRAGLAAITRIVNELGGGDTVRVYDKMLWPTDYHVVTQRFGENPELYAPFHIPGHDGLDVRGPEGAKVYAPMDGEIVFSESQIRRGATHSYGNHIRIKGVWQGKPTTVMLAHFAEPASDYGVEPPAVLKAGDRVERGQWIGKADSTGNVRGPHVHIAVKVEGAQTPGYEPGFVDPEPYFEV